MIRGNKNTDHAMLRRRTVNGPYDVMIIGGGVVGCAIARELSKYRLRTAVLEKDPDVGYETSGRNTGVCHGGFAYDPGTLKARLCLEGNRLMDQVSAELDFPFKRCGKVLVGKTEADYDRLQEVLAQGEKIGVTGLEMISGEELHRLIPGVVGNFALLSKTSGILDPFMMTIALAENAAANGTKFFFEREVTHIRRCDGLYRIKAGGDEFAARWVVNSAGLACGRISDMLGLTGYRIIYSKDDYIILDRRLGAQVPMPIYTVPSNTYMGIHVTVTTDGNLLLGPTAEDTDNDHCYAVDQKNIDYLYRAAIDIWPHFTKRDYIRTYSGILPKWADEQGRIQDFRIEIDDEKAPNAVNLVGIESPGLTAAVAIARYAIDMMRDREPFPEDPGWNPVRRGTPRFADLTEDEQAELIKKDPDWGEIICRCGKVTKAEILAAIRNPLGVHTVTGIKYRTRAMMGRCQGGYCQMRLTRMLEEACSLRPEEIVYSRPGSQMLFGEMLPRGPSSQDHSRNGEE